MTSFVNLGLGSTTKKVLEATEHPATRREAGFSVWSLFDFHAYRQYTLSTKGKRFSRA